MPSKTRQLLSLVQYLVARVLWIPITGNPRHNRTYGELKRLRPREAFVHLIPFFVYVGIATWVYFFFPRDLLPVAGSVYGAGILLGGSLIMTTVVVNQIVKLQHRAR